MRIAHFVQRYPPALGGSELFFARLSRYFHASGHQVSVFTTTALDLEAFWSRDARLAPDGICTEDGVEIRRYPISHWPARRYILKALTLVPNRKWQCMTLPCNPISWPMWLDADRNGRQFDLVHATAFPYAWPIVCGLRLAKKQNIPFVITPFLHIGNPDNPSDRTRRQYLSPALLWLLRQASRVFVQSGLEREIVQASGVDKDKTVLLGMGVCEKECTGGDRRRIRQEWNAGPSDVVIGHLANNSEEKGSVDLLKATEIAWSRGARFRLVLAGPEMPNFRRFWTHYSPAPQVVRMGVLSEEQKRDFFSGIDVFALPSRSDSFGMVLLEAWANAVPNVAYRAGGVAELVQNEVDGLLVDCGHVDPLANVLTRISEDAELRRRLGTAGRERTRKEFRWEDKLERVRDVYEKVTGGRD